MAATNVEKFMNKVMQDQDLSAKYTADSEEYFATHACEDVDLEDLQMHFVMDVVIPSAMAVGLPFTFAEFLNYTLTMVEAGGQELTEEDLSMIAGGAFRIQGMQLPERVWNHVENVWGGLIF